MPDVKYSQQRIHGNSEAYRNYEVRVGREVVLPLLKKWEWSPTGKKILELGCAEAGLLDAFHDEGCEVAGVELTESRAAYARKLAPYDLNVHVGDITLPDLPERIPGNWDLIIFRDVIEHLSDKEQTMRNIRGLLSTDGRLFLETCPWYMPFGGHQQAMSSRFRFVPWLHLLPRNTYKNFLLNTLKQSPALVEDMVEGTYDRGITMRQLNLLVRQTGFSIDREQLYFINPAYRVRFGFPEIRWPFNSRFPLLPEFAATSVAMLLKLKI
jgi:2-polyprenyl-3-methyl-5-hydroxy-6-metoxy-1,4-benzoquinol methylase